MTECKTCGYDPNSLEAALDVVKHNPNSVIQIVMAKALLCWIKQNSNDHKIRLSMDRMFNEKE